MENSNGTSSKEKGVPKTPSKPSSKSLRDDSASKFSSWISNESSVIVQFIFLKVLAIVYIGAFTSIYTQVQGLFGEDGLAPVSDHMIKTQYSYEGSTKYIKAPTVFWAAELINPYIITVLPHFDEFSPFENLFYVLCILNIAIAFGVLVDFRAVFFVRSWAFLIMWLSYLSIYVVGQPFMTTDADKLLLEIGFLSIFFIPSKKSRNFYQDEFSCIARELLKWLAFRFIFMNGIGKLLGPDSSLWWTLKAYSFSFQTHPLPGPLAKLFHYLPQDIHQMTAAFTLASEILFPVFLYAPIPSLRKIVALIHIVLQIIQITVGNFSWLHFCVIILLCNFLDDSFFRIFPFNFLARCLGVPKDCFVPLLQKQKPLLPKLLEFILSVAIIGAQFLLYFSLEYTITGRVIFNPKYLQDNIINSYYVMVPLYSAIVFGILSLVQYFLDPKPQTLSKAIIKIFKSLLAFCFFIFIFSITLEPFFATIQAKWTLLPKETEYLQTYIQKVYKSIESLQITHSYTPLPVMRGAQGRKELIIQGSFNGEEWLDYEFNFKPGNLEKNNNFLGLHQPRLDWKMFEAAYSDINHQLWLVNLVRKLFVNSRFPIILMRSNPFSQNPPNYIRIKLHKYTFADPQSRRDDSDRTWEIMRGQEVEYYLPSFHRRDRMLKELLEKREHYVSPLREVDNIHPAQTILLFNVVYWVSACALFWNLMFA